MSRTRISITTSAIIMLCAATAAFAADSAEDIKQRRGAGDPVAGKTKIGICQTCHGSNGDSTLSHYPKLNGQYADYIVKQVNDFKLGARKDPMMSAMVQSAGSDQDMLDIAAYFASQNQMRSVKRVANKAGEARFKSAENGCAACHGLNGKGLAPDQSQAPVIGGQHKDYLVKQLKGFRKGIRANDPGNIMGMIAGAMSDAEIEDVASYIAGL